MALIKTAEEIQAMREGGKILSDALACAVRMVRPGVSLKALDVCAEEYMRSQGATPSFKGYKAGGGIPFPSTVCISVNDEVVHGLGNRERILAEGDIVGLDIGCWYKGMCTDMAVTVPVGAISAARKKLLGLTRASLYAGVERARVGLSTRDIAAAIQGEIPRGYGIIKSLVGHGVGHAVHESPHVPNFVSNAFPKVPLRSGMCLALEPMITRGSDEVDLSSDGWTLVTDDGSDAAHFEVTIALHEDGPEILTPEPSEVTAYYETR